MKSLLLTIFVFTLAWSPASWGLTEKVLNISPQHKVYFRYQKAKKNKPTIVLLNGLIYSISHWDGFVKELTDEGFGVVQTAYSTQPESLVELDEDVSPYYNETELFWGFTKQTGIETQTLIDETMAVIDYLKVKNFTLMSLSYGTIVASEMAVQQKDRIDSLILTAPAVKTSGRYNWWGQGRHLYYTTLVLSGNPLADYSYDQEIKSTLQLLITPMKYDFEGVEFKDFFDGVYQMARSSKWFDLHDYADADLPDTYLFLASLEDGPLYDDQMEFWEKMKDNPARKAMVLFDGSYHAIPGVAPEKSAKEVALVLRGKLTSTEKVVNVGNQSGVTGDKKSSLFDSSSWFSASRSSSQ